MKQLAPAALTVALLVAVAFDIDAMQVDSVDAGPYHAKVTRMAETIPADLAGRWISRDVEMMPEATKLLKPNVTLLRRYENLDGGVSFGLMFVQSADARDMGGHYPPVCYPAQGWIEDKSARRATSWEFSDATMPGMEYVFTRKAVDGETRIVVQNLIVLPDGRMVRETKPVYGVAGDYQKRAYGAAQFQIIFDGSVERGVRDRITQLVLSVNRPLIDLLMSGVPHEHR